MAAGKAAKLPVYRRRKPGRGSELTPQESRILELLVTYGLTNLDIGKELEISVETVKRHLYAIMDKTGYSTRLELAVRTLQSRHQPTHCACGSVRQHFPLAMEVEVPATPLRPAEYRIYDQDPPTRCLGRSNKNFDGAWRIARGLLLPALDEAMP